MPEHYTHKKKEGFHIWTLRKQRMKYPTIGRMFQITPTGKNSELYHYVKLTWDNLTQNKIINIINLLYSYSIFKKISFT